MSLLLLFTAGPRAIAVGPSAFIFSGQDVAFKIGLPIGGAAYVLTGNAVTLNIGRRLSIDAGTYVLSGTTVSFQATRFLAAERGAFVLIWSDTGLYRRILSTKQITDSLPVRFNRLDQFSA
jgi:hypothetical protein